MADNEQSNILTLTAEIVASYVGSGAHLKADEIPGLIKTVRAALQESTTTGDDPATEAATPKATKAQIKKSIGDDHLISFIDNKPYKTLKRHLTRHGMSISEYRDRYGLPGDYPSVAASYSAARSQMAKSLGLGARRKTEAAPASPPKAAPKPRRKPAEPAEPK